MQRHPRLRLTALFLITASCFSVPVQALDEALDSLDPRARDFSRLAYTRSTVDFCPEVDRVYTGTIRRQDDCHRLELSVLVEVPRVEGVPCSENLPLAPPGSCHEVVSLPPRCLSDLELLAVRWTIDRALDTLADSPDPFCPLWDPCRITQFELDDEVLIRDFCASSHLSDEGATALLELFEDLRFGAVTGSTLNGDIGGDGQRDVTDAIQLLGYLFLGHAPPVDLLCLPPTDCPGGRGGRRLLNGDIDGDSTRSVTDVIAYLTWLFLAGEEPRPACDCDPDPRAPCQEECGPDVDCVPDGLGGRVCVDVFTDCESIRQHYEMLVREYGNRCTEGGRECVALFGHCGISLGGCYHAVNPDRVTQADLDALARRFEEFFDEPGCIQGVCDCAPPPDRVECDGEGVCRMFWGE